jgi:hypothetical protein
LVECELAGETEVLGETCLGVTLSTTKPIWHDLGSNAGRRGGKPATNRLSYGTAYFFYLVGWDLTPIRSLCRSPRFV